MGKLYEGMTFKDGVLYKGTYILSSNFGHRILNGQPNNHKGIDFVGMDSKEIISPVSGKVMSSTIVTDKSNLTWQWGNYIRIDNGDKKHYFCHLSKRLVSVGQIVQKGQVIGIEGNTGYSFGSHLHFEVRDSKGVSIDPQIYFNISEERSKKPMEIKTVDEALKILHEKGIMNTTEYWKNATNVVKYLDTLLINIANKIGA